MWCEPGLQHLTLQAPLSKVTIPLLCTSIDTCLLGANMFRPSALNKRQHRPDVSIAKDILERRHVAPGTRTGGRITSKFSDLKQEVVRVVPSMTGFIMWRSRQSTRRQGLFPIGLSLEIHAVARRAMLGINGLARCNLCDIRRISIGFRRRKTCSL